MAPNSFHQRVYPLLLTLVAAGLFSLWNWFSAPSWTPGAWLVWPQHRLALPWLQAECFCLSWQSPSVSWAVPGPLGLLAHFSLKRHSFSLWKTGFGYGHVCPAVFKMDNQQGPTISKLPNFSPHSHLLPHSVSSCSSTSFPKLFLNGPLSHCGGRGASHMDSCSHAPHPSDYRFQGSFSWESLDTLVENSHWPEFKTSTPASSGAWLLPCSKFQFLYLKYVQTMVLMIKVKWANSKSSAWNTVALHECSSPYSHGHPHFHPHPHGLRTEQMLSEYLLNSKWRDANFPLDLLIRTFQ